MSIELSRVVEFHRLMDAKNVVLIYEGEFNQAITKGVLSMSEQNFNGEAVALSVKKKMFNVMVESLQNICKHQYIDNALPKKAIFIVAENESDIFIMSGNAVKSEQVSALREKLDLINGLDKEGLKALYKDLRVKSTISEVGGAGLGFVDMARKSENKLEYKIEPLGSDIDYFSLSCKIAKSTEGGD
jgi:hypothetical protein